MVTPSEDYTLGLQAGKRDARLDGHDRQFIGLQSSLENLGSDVRALNNDFRKLIGDLSLGVQALGLNAKSSADTAITLAEGVEKERLSNALAIKKEKDDEKSKDDRTWSPWPKVALLASLVFGLLGTIYTITH